MIKIDQDLAIIKKEDSYKYNIVKGVFEATYIALNNTENNLFEDKNNKPYIAVNFVNNQFYNYLIVTPKAVNKYVESIKNFNDTDSRVRIIYENISNVTEHFIWNYDNISKQMLN